MPPLKITPKTDAAAHINLRELYQHTHPGKTQQAKAQEMSRYMKNLFPFIGIPKPERAALTRPILNASKNWPQNQLIEHIQHYYNQPEREYQYFAIDLIQANIKTLTWTNWQQHLLPLIDQYPWWDSVDAIRKPLGLYLRQHPKQLAELIKTYKKSASIWQRRIAITVQLQYKNTTNTALLAQAILASQEENEFFIQKGIGWALRDYSKTDPQWVKNFISTHTLSKLAVREGSKYI